MIDTATILLRVLEHLGYSGLAIGIAAVIAVPLGLYIGHTGRGSWAIAGANALRALPSLGLMTLLVLVIGSGVVPPTIALVILAVPPILANTAAGISVADPAAVDAARAMGMTDRQLLGQVELPIALPLIVSGFRAAALQVVATATIAAFVNLGGIGRFIFDGLALYDYGRVVLGAVLVAAVALALDGALALVARAVTPGRVRRTPGRAASANGRRPDSANERVGE